MSLVVGLNQLAAANYFPKTLLKPMANLLRTE